MDTRTLKERADALFATNPYMGLPETEYISPSEYAYLLNKVKNLITILDESFCTEFLREYESDIEDYINIDKFYAFLKKSQYMYEGWPCRYLLAILSHVSRCGNTTGIVVSENTTDKMNKFKQQVIDSVIAEIEDQAIEIIEHFILPIEETIGSDKMKQLFDYCECTNCDVKQSW